MLCLDIIRPGDNPELARLIRKVLSEFDADKEGYASRDPETDCMYESYDAEGYCYYTLRDEQHLLGGGGVAPLVGETLDYCEIQKMYFDKRIRGKGYGSDLLELLLKEARDFGYRYAYIETLSTMDAAQKLYKRMGFKPIEKRLGLTGHGGCNTFYLCELRGR